MRAVEILKEEHRLLRRALLRLEALLRRATRDDHLDGVEVGELLLFLERFADGSHQDKEEQVLFPALLSASSADDQRCVRAHLEVHAAERRRLEELRAGFEAAAYGDPLSLDLFVSRARAYVRFQREHAAQEEAQLLPLAERVLGAEVDARLVAGFARIDRRVQRGVPSKARSARTFPRRIAVGPAARPFAAGFRALTSAVSHRPDFDRGQAAGRDGVLRFPPLIGPSIEDAGASSTKVIPGVRSRGG